MRLKVVFIILITVLMVIDATGQKNNKKLTINGTVTDMNNKPVPEIAIFIDDKNTNKLTDADGRFRVKVKPDAQMISVRLISGQTTGTLINGQSVINLTLPVDITKALYVESISGDEEVNVGYGTVKRRDLTTSVGKVNNRQNRYANYKDIYEMLRGEVPGVQVVGRSIKIQNASSFMSGTEPLLVVDGVVVNTIDDIPPYMVRSVEVLKGSAAAIYGVRGANGVILITLTKGSDNK